MLVKANKYLGYAFDYKSFVNDFSDNITIKDGYEYYDEYEYEAFIGSCPLKAGGSEQLRIKAEISCFGDYHVKRMCLYAYIGDKEAKDLKVKLSDAYRILDKYFNSADNGIILDEFKGKGYA